MRGGDSLSEVTPKLYCFTDQTNLLPPLENPMKSPSRNFGLDLLRSLAIVMVLCNHYFLGFHISTGRVIWADWKAGVSAISILAIEWLFVLSGFLIGTMMIRSFEKGATWWQRARDFWLRRWFRTFPNYYLFLIINAVLSLVGIGTGTFSFDFVIFSQNLAWPEKHPHFFGEAWSLALDEWFYFIMPLLLGLSAVVLQRGTRNTFLGTAIALILLPTIGRLVVEPSPDFFHWDAHIRRVTVFHLDATGWGVLAAVTSRWMPALWENWRKAQALVGALLTVTGMAMIEFLVFSGWGNSGLYRACNAFSLSLPAVGAFLFLPWLASLRTNQAVVHWITDRISLYSYSIYLCHYPAIFVVQAWFAIDANSAPSHVLFASATWLALTLGISALTYISFEKPVSDMRDRFTRHVNASPFTKRESAKGS